MRSLLTAGLLASAAFLIVVVESFRREPDRDFLNEKAGSGGFALLAESDVPIFQDLNSDSGRDEILDELKRRNINADCAQGRHVLSVPPSCRRRRQLPEPLPTGPAAHCSVCRNP